MDPYHWEQPFESLENYVTEWYGLKPPGERVTDGWLNQAIPNRDMGQGYSNKITQNQKDVSGQLWLSFLPLLY